MTVNENNATIAALPVTSAPVAVIMTKQENISLLLPKIDPVNITSAARAKSMKLEGLSVAQIAQAMGLHTDVIWAFLQMQPMASASFPASAAP